MRCSICHQEYCGAKCGCQKPILGIEPVSKESLVLRFNVNGVTTEYDFSELIARGQTDTTLSVDTVKRLLKYVAERHIDSIPAEQLGSILHLADIGDVNTQGVENGSSLVYQKDNDCGNGCVGTGNGWKAWNALDNIAESGYYLSLYDKDGYPYALSAPENTDQFYLLGWNAAGQLSYTQPSIATAKPAGAYTVYMDATTKELIAVEED